MEMLGKAWPPELKEGSKTSEKERDEILLKHLLYWPTWPGFLTFFGKKFLSASTTSIQIGCIK
jgi:hypothetical protein